MGIPQLSLFPSWIERRLRTSSTLPTLLCDRVQKSRFRFGVLRLGWRSWMVHGTIVQRRTQPSELIQRCLWMRLRVLCCGGGVVRGAVVGQYAVLRTKDRRKAGEGSCLQTRARSLIHPGWLSGSPQQAHQRTMPASPRTCSERCAVASLSLAPPSPRSRWLLSVLRRSLPCSCVAEELLWSSILASTASTAQPQCPAAPSLPSVSKGIVPWVHRGRR